MNNIEHIIEYFGLIMKTWIEVEGMKAKNQERVSTGHSIAYSEVAFLNCAEEIVGYIESLQKLP